ncbi:hypothetical protein FE257_006262 [Aspergillus nanangensis]|uniref:FAD dependent oxidoreductase domain-containing protein n=1 Tax=Aspergillus nanangensis TaxID=2582783 RepID=A0AAD4CP60_ASPNN|nr:hypothetical protein FE257_006262 [Aspergillus nanangensis]
MARITIVGSGIVGMATAAMLSRHHKVTIIARNLPGDEPSIDWASPWAGVSFVAGGCTSAREEKMQLDSFTELWRWGEAYPESSIRRVRMEDFYDDDKNPEEVWWKVLPEFRVLPAHVLPKGAKAGTSYTTLVLNPSIFLPWLKQQLEGWGVEFRRMHLNALSDASHLRHDVLINATGIGSKFLSDIADQDVELVRGQTLIVKSDYQKMFMHDNGKDYTYAIPRMDGTVILGGIRQPDSTNPEVDLEISKDIVRRLNADLPNVFSADLAEYDIIGHNVGIRPGRSSGIRIERDLRGGQNIVHVYGFSGGGYIHSFGAARMARDLVEDVLFPLSRSVAKL